MRRMATSQIKDALMQLQSASTTSFSRRQNGFPSFRLLPLSLPEPHHTPSPTTITTTRLYATRPGASERYMTPMQRVTHNRSQLRSSQPMELLRVAGVSFEGRQEAVAQLQPLQALAFQKEPENQYDPNAVAVHTLDGVPLGYVPKDRTGAFLHILCFGQVHSVGQADGGGMWGCSAEVQPRVPPVRVLPIPANLSGKCHVGEMLQGAEKWEAVKAEILKKSGGRCLVSGAATSFVGEQWEVREKEKVLKLQGFSALAPEVARIAYMLDSGENLRKELALMNGWREEDLETYVGYVEKQRSRMSEEGEWKLDVKVLENMGIAVPEELKAFVV
jgi:hypothetical protein